MIILKIKGDYVITPRILFNDKKLSRTEIDVLSTIISLALKKDYCYASNEYLANYVNSSKRTITKSLSKLKELKYILVRYVDNKRRIYLNLDKLKTIISSEVAENDYQRVEESFYHKRNNRKENNNKYKKVSPIPYWLEHPEVCKEDPMSEDDIAEMEELLKEFKN